MSRRGEQRIFEKESASNAKSFTGRRNKNNFPARYNKLELEIELFQHTQWMYQ